MKSLHFLPVLLPLILFQKAFAQKESGCDDYCYLKDSIKGKCTICFNDCQKSTKSFFLSCSIKHVNSEQALNLDEALCKSQCYPETYASPQKNTQNYEETQISFEQLQKIKRETENWTPQSQRLINATLFMVGSSLLLILGFVLIWRQVGKRRKMRKIQEKQQKEWVKCFEKVNSSDTTICSIDIKESAIFEGNS